MQPTTVSARAASYNFIAHDAERFAFRLAASGGRYDELEACGYGTPEGKILVTELARTHLEQRRGLDYPEDPIGALLRLSGMGKSLLENNLKTTDPTEFRSAKIRRAFEQGAAVSELAGATLAEAGRALRAIFLSREGSNAEGILPLATRQTIDALSTAAGRDLITEISRTTDEGKAVELSLSVLRKAGLIDRD